MARERESGRAKPEQRRKSWMHVPPILILVFWQLRQTWRLLLITGCGMVAAVVLVCAIPLYSQVTTTAGLRDTLTSLGQNADIVVHSTAAQILGSAIQSISQRINIAVQEQLGPYLNPSPQFSIQTPGLPFNSQNSYQKGNQLLLIGSPVQQAPAHVRLLQGRLPGLLSNGIEIAITPETAASLHIKVGATLHVRLLYDNASSGQVKRDLPLSVVGLFTPKEDDSFWHGESFQGMSVGETTTYQALMSNETFISTLMRISPGIPGQQPGPVLDAPVTLFWYYHLDPLHIDVNHLDAILKGLSNVLNGFSSSDAYTDNPYVQSTQATGPLDALLQYRDRLSVVSIPVMSLTFLVLGLVLFFMIVMVNLMVDRHQDAIAMFRRRGASRRQVFGSLVLQCLGLSFFVLLLGPPLAIVTAYFLLRTLSPNALAAFDTISNHPAQTLQGLSISTLLTVGVAVLAMIVSLLRVISMDVLALRRETARSTRLPLWVRLNLDIIAAIIALAGYAYSLYLAHSNVLDAKTRILVLSPLTLAGSILLLLGCTLLFLRGFPFLLRAGAWLARRSRGAALPLALAQIARAPRQSLRMTTLLSLALAFAIFALVFTASQSQRAADVAAYQVGADFTGTVEASQLGFKSAAAETAAYRAIPGVISATVGYSSPMYVLTNQQMITLEMRAMDVDTFEQTAIWTPQNSSQPLASLMRQLVSQREAAILSMTVPAIVDASAWNTLGLKPGAVFSLDNLFIKVNFEAIAEVQHIPTIDESTIPAGGILVDYSTYAAVYTTVANLQGSNMFIQPNVVWLRTKDDPASLASVRKAVSTGKLQFDHFTDRRALMAALQIDPLYLDLIGILALGTMMALLLALIGDLLTSWLNARSRLTNFALLRALGSTPRQIASVLFWEQSIVYLTAIVLGVVFGVLLSVLTLPSLIFTSVNTSQLNAENVYALQSVPPVQMVVPVTLFLALGVVVVICGVTLGMMMRVVSRPTMGQVLRLNQD